MGDELSAVVLFLFLTCVALYKLGILDIIRFFAAAARPSAASSIHTYTFKNRTSLKTAVKLWRSDEHNAREQYGDIAYWDVSNVTDMYGMFRYAESFNGDISDWDVSNVTDMSDMFYGAKSFNCDLSSWDVSRVIHMEDMFLGAYLFEEENKPRFNC